MEVSDATEKKPAILGIDPGTFGLVVQCLNHYATPGPFFIPNIPKRENELSLINESVLQVSKFFSSIENASLSSPCRSPYKTIG
jgi:hypothetical protein